MGLMTWLMASQIVALRLLAFKAASASTGITCRVKDDDFVVFWWHEYTKVQGDTR